MTRKEVISDLNLIKISYLRDKGYYPRALDYAIDFIQEKIGNTLEVEEYKEEDFYDDLPFC